MPALFAAAALVTAHATAQVYRCTDDSGRTTYSDAPCASGGRALKLPGDAAGTAPMSPSVCAQIQDERTRLAAEAERNAARGRAESADSVKRRHDLARTYETRCAGIRRSVPAAK